MPRTHKKCTDNGYETLRMAQMGVQKQDGDLERFSNHSPTHKKSPDNDYESIRKARIAENQVRLAQLGLQKQAGDLIALLRVAKSASKFKHHSVQKSVFENETPLRRSQRLKKTNSSTPNTEYKTLPSPFSQTEKDGLFYSDNDKNLSNGEIRPTNAQLPKNSHADALLSPDLLSHRCNRKGRDPVRDSIVGICCHFCREKKACREENCERCRNMDVTKICIGNTECSRCHSSTGVICRHCLKVRYGEDIEEVRENKNWMCPHCSEESGINPYWICNNSVCLRKRNIQPTGIAAYKDLAMGYESFP